MGGMRVIVVDDDPTTRDVLRRYLSRAGLDVVECADGATALEAFGRQAPDLMVLDLMMPGIDGIDVCREVRRTSDIPILMLTALGSESDRVVGLEQGADDYVVKPFSPREVTLRIERLLQRSAPRPAAADTVSDGDLRMDLRARTVTLAGDPVDLTTREFDLLSFFMSHPDEAFTRTDLLRSVWDWSFGDTSTVTVHVRRLREKIERDPAAPQRLRTVWGTGYRYQPATPSGGRR